jgi:hypothetical protein
MLVKQLIEELQRQPMDMEVFITDKEMEMVGTTKAVYTIDGREADRSPCCSADADAVVILIDGFFKDLAE